MTANETYEIDHVRLVRWLTPSRLRNNRLLAWLYLLAWPVVYLYQLFLPFRAARLYELAITPQVCYLEQLLNDRYDFTARRIYIEDGVEEEALYLYQDDENHPVYLYQDDEGHPVILYTDGEINGDLSDDFVVMVPFDIVFNTVEMRSLVNKFRLPGMRFKIQTF